jgi:GT2 family glycosyltransferase/2-polyprenyl-3-methyl-5-hydroxy-6-metoxy-1,4-benzoquinol methylase
MSNYDFTLDMETDNSNSLILRNIKPGSVVLEMGCAHGRMTKYLKEQLNCEVYIVEYDKTAGEVAKQYATASWVGEEKGDIERFRWFTALNEAGIKFDYIIYADVLEHLRAPDEVLKESVKLLKASGSVLCSIPNVAYNGLMIDLLQDKFEYRDTGILDKTHIKFFTHSSLQQFVGAAGLVVANEFNAINTVANSEFANSYNQLPKEVGEYLQKRKYGEVYQFIWELKKTNVQVSIITPVFNKWNFTKSYLEDMLRLSSAKVEVIVVDNASTDETAEKIVAYQKRMPNLKYIRNNDNLGFGAACNIGYNNAIGEHVLFLNNDIRVKERFEDWIDILVEKCNDNNLVSPTGGKVDPDNDFKFLYETNDPTKDINYLSGWCLMAKKSVWEKFIEADYQYRGPFSKSFFVYFEDTDLGFRARATNIDLNMADVPVVHFGKVSSKQLNTFSLYNESRATFIKLWKTK